MKYIVWVLVLIGVVLSSGILAFASDDDKPAETTLRRLRVPILMYHYVSELPPGADDMRRGLTVTPERFTAHMQFLHDQGYTTISLYDLNDALTKGTPLPPKPIILTFDDGYSDAYTNVFPVLKQFGFIADRKSVV